MVPPAGKQAAMIAFTLNGQPARAREGASLLEAAAGNGVYLPALCGHPDLPPFDGLAFAPHVHRGGVRLEHQPAAAGALRRLEGCGLCVVEVEGAAEPVRACRTPVEAGAVITTESAALGERRQAALMEIMARHPHACLTCAQNEGCSLEDCSSGVPREERCCAQFHDCELRRIAEHVGIQEETPRYRPAGLAVLDGEPLFVRDANLCIDCARCVRVCNQVRGVEALGLVHRDGRLWVGSRAPTLQASGCKFCGACVEVCPTGCLTDRAPGPGDRAAWLVPCVHACPAAGDVPEYVRRIATGDLAGAAAVIEERLPLANTLGHICFAPCEKACRRGALDDPIAICALKRFALEHGDGARLESLAAASPTGKKVAVVGAGPAGLAAGFFLRVKGHACTLFEAAPAAGGMPARTVPDYRLPRDVLEKDIAVLRALGVEIKTGCRLASARAMTGLLDRGYDAVLIAVGLPGSNRIALEGSQLAGVHWGLEFLGEVKAGRAFDLGRRIVVVGGGNVAVDAAMSARRLSGGEVEMVCLERRDAMPAHAAEVAKAEAEGITVRPGWGPAAIEGAGGRVTGVALRRCVSVLDARGRFAPAYDEGERTRVDADAVILAVGQVGPESVPGERGGVFLAGDIAGNGPQSVVHAVASGRGAAERIDRHLGGDGVITVRLTDHPRPDPRIGREAGFAPRERVPVPAAAPADRWVDFRLIEGTYRPEDAVVEARRCLQCDLRLTIRRPPLPPERWLALVRANVERAPETEGVLVLADADRRPVVIQGTANLRAALLEKLEGGTGARLFFWEEDRMYSQRESELIQQHLRRHGELPAGGADDLDDLF